jgi:hypothetical protein
VEPGGLAIPHLPDMRERGRHFATGFGLRSELSDHGDAIAEGFEEAIGLGTELIELSGTAAKTSSATL